MTIDEKSYYKLGVEFAEQLASLSPIQEVVKLREEIKNYADYTSQTEFLLGVRDAKLSTHFKKLQQHFSVWAAGKGVAELSLALQELDDHLYRKGIVK